MRFVYMNVPDDERLSVFSVVNTNCLLPHRQERQLNPIKNSKKSASFP